MICKECGREAIGTKQTGQIVERLGEVILYVCYYCQKIVGTTLDGKVVNLSDL